MANFIRSTQPTLSLREKYLSSLAEPQEWFLEELIEQGQVWTHPDGSYAITQDKTLLEFFSAEPSLMKERLSAFHNQNGVAKALVKSYDHGLVQACQQLGWTSAIGGLLFRAREKGRTVTFENAQMRVATLGDKFAIWRINDGFFESEVELASLLRAHKIWVVIVEGEVAGFGLAQLVLETGNAVDIGMLVAPNMRRKGLGTFIICELANMLEQRGMRAICGCGVSNIASRKTLENAGFVSNHQLLAFTP